jgi:hypothetical protein
MGLILALAFNAVWDATTGLPPAMSVADRAVSVIMTYVSMLTTFICIETAIEGVE